MRKTYLFYDIETSGLNKCFDQVLQFAAIRTDEDFNELSRVNQRIKLNPDTLPHPGAMIACDLLIEDIIDGELEFDVIRAIHAEFNTPGTTTIGYNTLGFDDEFLRFSFYRNLLTPYTHQYKNNCQRWDLFPMMPVFYALAPEVIRWPIVDDKVSLKLEHLNAENQFAHGAAHDALVDVEVTLALAKQLRTHTQQWDYLTGFFDKNTTMTRWAGLAKTNAIETSLPVGILFTPRVGFANAFISPVLNLGMHQHYTNASCWLRLDGLDFNAVDPATLLTQLWVQNIKLNEPQCIFPFTERFMTGLSTSRLEQVKRNIVFLEQHPAVFAMITQHYRQYKYPFIEDVDIDAALYQRGFPDNQQQAQAARFTASQSLDEMMQAMSSLADPGIASMAARVIGRIHDQSLIGTSAYENFQHYMQRVMTRDPQYALVDYRNARRFTLGDMDAEITRVLGDEQCTARMKAIVESLQRYCAQL